MKKKLTSVLLIDDSDADNYIHARRIRKAKITDDVVIKSNGKLALDYLSELGNSVPPRPDLIFLDINMPVMNGWEFLDAYEKLPTSHRGRTLVTMLTTSAAETDRSRAATFKSIDAYLEKPLTQEKIATILREHFPDHL